MRTLRSAPAAAKRWRLEDTERIGREASAIVLIAVKSCKLQKRVAEPHQKMKILDDFGRESGHGRGYKHCTVWSMS